MDKPAWLEVSLVVSPEQAEAVADVLGRYTPEGVVVEQMARQTKTEKTHLEDQVRVFGYMFADGSLEEKKMRLEEALFYLSRIQPLPKPEYHFIHDQNWMAAWKDQYQPLKVGKTLAILPAWVEDAFPERTAIRINPGMAFGTGTHPTTQLCLQFMETLVQEGTDVIDVGCGSGILSIAAVLLGAEHAYGADISAAAVQSSRENAALNNTQNQTTFIQGSVPEILSGELEIVEAPLVIVNILAPIILRLFDEGLSDLVADDGNLILAGILDTQAENILQKALSHQFSLSGRLEIDDWVALSLRKTAAD